MAQEKVTIFVARYSSKEEALGDLEIIENERAEQRGTTFDIALLEKDEQGKRHVSKKHEAARGLGGWTGFGAGLLIGMLFPPLAPEIGLVGAAAGVGVAHFWKGMSRSDIRRLGDMLDTCDAALVAVINSAHADAIAPLLGRAVEVERVETDANMKDIDDAITQVAAAHASAAKGA